MESLSSSNDQETDYDRFSDEEDIYLSSESEYEVKQRDIIS